MRNQKLGVHFSEILKSIRMKFSVFAQICWFVEAHVNFILHNIQGRELC